MSLGRGSLTDTVENCALALTEQALAEQMCVLSVHACTQLDSLSEQ